LRPGSEVRIGRVSAKTIARRAAGPLLGVLAVLLIAATPDALRVDNEQVVLHPQAFVRDVVSYLSDLATGDAWLYHERGGEVRSFLPQALDRFFRSVSYLLPAGLLAVSLGLSAGLLVTAGRRDRLREVLTSIAVVPDFVLALLLQLVVVWIYKSTGVRVARVVSLTISEPALLLPLLTMTVVPFISVLRTVSTRAYLAAGEDHSLTARSLGLSRWHTYVHWIGPITVTYLRADTARLSGMMVGNLFIVEYLFNIRGVTAFIFSRGMLGGYQYALVANGLLLTIGLYLALYFAIQTALRLALAAVTRA
jgi:peptide/nickel transport system permease protein